MNVCHIARKRFRGGPGSNLKIKKSYLSSAVQRSSSRVFDFCKDLLGYAIDEILIAGL